MGLRGFEFAPDIFKSFPSIHSGFPVVFERRVTFRKDALRFGVDQFPFARSGWSRTARALIVAYSAI
jgi:hypothetical protein